MAIFKEIISNKKLLFLIYGILIVLSCLGFESKLYIPFYLAFAFFIGWLYFFGEEEGKKELKLSRWLIIIPLVIILATRIIPFLFSEAPLGYDTGIYKKTIENFSGALPNLPQFSEMASGAQESWGLYINTNLSSFVSPSFHSFYKTHQPMSILYFFYILIFSFSIELLQRSPQ